jgi:Lrp/AsnC family transcriptional regulator, leucine-responsive regulatory protein
MNEIDATLDAVDHKLLALLQQDGKATQEALAQRVKLSASAVLRRVRRLEEAGVIKRYAAIVDAERIGLMLTAYLSVRLEKHSTQNKATPLELFKAAVQTWSEVTECAALTGEMDYLLRVQVRDMAHYSHFVLETLLRNPSVQDVKSSFVLAKIKG